MSFSYETVAKQIALRAGQLEDAEDADALETQFTGDIADILGGVEVPYTALKQSILAAEKRIAQVIGLSEFSEYRAALDSRSLDLTTGSILPTLDQNEVEFIGKFDGFFDSATDEPLTECTKQEYRRWKRNAGGAFRLPAYRFHKEGTKFFITTDSAYWKGCAYDYDAQDAIFEARGNSILPQGCETYLIAETLANLEQEDWFTNESSKYEGIAMACRAEILAGIEPTQKLAPANTFSDPVTQ